MTVYRKRCGRERGAGLHRKLGLKLVYRSAAHKAIRSNHCFIFASCQYTSITNWQLFKCLNLMHTCLRWLFLHLVLFIQHTKEYLVQGRSGGWAGPLKQFSEQMERDTQMPGPGYHTDGVSQLLAWGQWLLWEHRWEMYCFCLGGADHFTHLAIRQFDLKYLFKSNKWTKILAFSWSFDTWCEKDKIGFPEERWIHPPVLRVTVFQSSPVCFLTTGWAWCLISDISPLWAHFWQLGMDTQQECCCNCIWLRHEKVIMHCQGRQGVSVQRNW